MKKIEDLVLPVNLNQILDTDGIWSDDSFDPIVVNIMEAESNEEEITVFQLEFPAVDSFEKIEAIMEANGLELSGQDWEDLIREYLYGIDEVFENKVESDSEGETCVLWVPDEASFRKLLGHVLDFVNDPNIAKRLLAG